MVDAGVLFDAFIAATQFGKIQQLFSQICALLDVDPYDSENVYRRLKNNLTDWRAKKLWAHLDKRAERKEYCGQKACKRLNVLVIGAGPCGLRSAIECALLGAHVVLVEQRDKFSRNNVLHIWPFVIQDLKNLGIKTFYPKFCRGSIDHISIRQLQCALLKVALVLGVQVHDSVAFQNLIFPKADENGKITGWRAEFEPAGHILSGYIFDALIGADGKRNTVPGFPKRELRGKLAIGITANFVNRRTLEEEKVQEISGVAYIFNQQFFKDMKEATGADLENIVYYKDETHYFVMCAKKQSLLDKGVIIEDNEDISCLLAPSNVDQEKLCEYAASAADFATAGKLPELKYALNHSGKEDVAMFDFTSLFSAQCSVRLVERLDQRLLMAIVGDTLHEPFWPTGSGCARGFLGVLDTAWMLRCYGLNKQGIMVMIAERESAYRLLAQAKPDNLHKQLHKYTIDPRTRYVSFELTVQPHEVSHLVDTDNPRNVDTNRPLPLRVGEGETSFDPVFVKRYKLWRFCQQELQPFRLKIINFGECWNDGRALAALVGKFRPDLIDYIGLCSSGDLESMFRTVTQSIEKEYEIRSVCKDLNDWSSLPTDDRVEYLDALVSRFKADSNRMLERLMNAIRATTVSHKRKANIQVDASRAKKSGPIQRRAADLLQAMASTAAVPVNGDRIVDDFLEGRHGEFSEQEIREVLTELNNDEEERKERHARRLENLDDRTDFKKLQNQLFRSGNTAVQHWTKRPAVDKLNPERLYAVERIVSGEVEAEKCRELYRNKRRQANILTRKMDQKDISEMEMKLEQTAMGLLFDKEHFRVLSSKEEKIVSANAAAARQTALDGFKRDNDRYKEIDEKLSRADSLLKNQNLAGVNTVSMIRQQNAALSPNEGPISPRIGKPPPPTPPKKNLSKRSDEKEEERSGSDQENNSRVVFRTSPAGTNLTQRPTSMPVMELSYDSVNAKQRQSCTLCCKTVYLAERMMVEGMFIHKKCFRCAFCGQPLRLGNCAQDRNLEKYNPRFFCMQHINLPLSEKISRIEKNDSRLMVRNDNLKVHSSSDASAESSPSVVSSFKPNDSQKNTEQSKERSGGLTSRFTELNSPASLLGKTMERMRAQREAAETSNLITAKSGTPERVEFEAFRKNKKNSKNPRAEFECGSSEDEVHDRQPGSTDAVVPLESSNGTSEDDGAEMSDGSSSSDDEDELMEADLIELEKTVLENIDKNLNDTLSDAQAVSLLQSFNRRRKTDTVESTSTPSSLNSTVYLTPKAVTDGIASEAFETPDTVFETPKICTKKEPETPSPTEQSIRERTLISLADYRAKARLKARLKSDEELGLSRPMTGRRSVGTRASRTSHSPSFELPKENATESSVNANKDKSDGPKQSEVVKTPKSVPLFCGHVAVDTAVSSRPPSPSGRGLLARLFSPDPNRVRKVPKRSMSQCTPRSSTNTSEAGSSSARNTKADFPHAASESQKETSMLDRLSSIKNLRRRKGSGEEQNVADICGNNDQEIAKRTYVTTTPSPISVTERNIRRIQKRAELIAKQKEQERVRTAQDIQRALQETEIRKAEVTAVGSDLEKRLCDDPRNRWVLEQWLLYVNEMEQLCFREEDLLRRVKEMEAIEEYKSLQRQLRQVQGEQSCFEQGGSSSTEKQLLKRMLEVIEKRDSVQQDMESSNARSARSASSDPQTLLAEKGASYRNFEPVFLKEVAQ